jgi:hypothetical protein
MADLARAAGFSSVYLWTRGLAEALARLILRPEYLSQFPEHSRACRFCSRFDYRVFRSASVASSTSPTVAIAGSLRVAVSCEWHSRSMAFAVEFGILNMPAPGASRTAFVSSDGAIEGSGI